MSADLLDVNLLVSLAWPNHVHHRSAQRWFRQHRRQGWATTPVTECGFVRVCSNRSAIPSAVAPAAAHSMLVRMRSVRGHVFLPDDVGLVVGEVPWTDAGRIVSHSFLTDAHLLAVARNHGVRLATLDRGVKALAGSEPEDVVLVPVS
jgi:toxin-antitoxin system PIN domain toxin